MELANFRKVIEECPDFIRSYLRQHDTLLKGNQLYKTTWTKGTWSIEFHIQCGSTGTMVSQVNDVCQGMNDAISESFDTSDNMYLDAHFNQKCSEPEVYYVELTIFLTEYFWRSVFDTNSLYELVTGLGPKLYPAMLIDAMELEGMPWCG